MNNTCNHINNSIIKIENNQFENYLKIYCKINPDKKISNVMKYLKSNGWSDFKFNEYSIRKELDNNYIIILNYVYSKLK